MFLYYAFLRHALVITIRFLLIVLPKLQGFVAQRRLMRMDAADLFVVQIKQVVAWTTSVMQLHLDLRIL